MNRSLKINLIPFLRGTALKRGAIFGSILFAALLAFEIFNFSTTQFALLDILGDLKFAGIRWATVLAIAFCGIDFAGIARIFTPEQGRDEPAEVWYLFGAWLLAAAFNAGLTWWGVSVAIAAQGNVTGTAVVSSATITKAVPVIVAVMVWLIRILIIGTFSMAGDRLFTTDHNAARNYPTRTNQSVQQPVLRPASQIQRPAASNASAYRPAPKPAQQTSFARPEPTYHNVNFSERNNPSEHYDA